MKKRVIIAIIGLILLININFIFANETIEISYPLIINSGEEFDVGISAINFSTGIYDIKIDFITNLSRTAKIWNGESFQSTFNYVNDAIKINPDEDIVNKKFTLNISSLYNQTGELIIRFRDSSGKTFSYTGYYMNITATDTIDTEDDEENNQEIIEEPEIFLKLSWDEEDIKNGEEFEIKIKAYNLEDKDYDVKLYIYDEDENKPISQVYDNKWISPTSYINEFFRGPGNKSETIKLRIKDSYNDFFGDASLGIRIRENGKTSYFFEDEDVIEILEKEDDIADYSSNNLDLNKSVIKEYKTENIKSAQVLEEKIYLGGSKAKSENLKSNNNIVYQSNNELIKKYSIYSFIILMIIFFGVIVFIYKKGKNAWQIK